ncbi:BRCT domain-containing protein [Variovorax paradoxus]|uniref:BRCT domain-containing protein n=1 Tax=Variovorax paradoxus TaxID=34073 RepID=UPI00193181C9|nr:BRCT domain-containing protein [Variovorax paradoxus]
MSNIYARQAAAFRNEMRTSCAALVGIVQGILADGAINDQEIMFLRTWLRESESVSLTWPGSVIYGQIEHALADGHISFEERSHLQETLTQLLGGRLDEVAGSSHVTELPIDRPEVIEFKEKAFCFTGDFVFGPRSSCEVAVLSRGGNIANVSKKLHYLVVGGMGSPEWKHGSFGTKIEKAILHKQAGIPLLIVHEDTWASSMVVKAA